MNKVTYVWLGKYKTTTQAGKRLHIRGEARMHVASDISTHFWDHPRLTGLRSRDQRPMSR